MQAERKDIAALLQLQQFDLEALRAQKTLDELPQRKQILESREKKKSIETKKVQVDEMRKIADFDIKRISDEDERLVAKQRLVQEKINEVQGDYRAIEAHTKELGGIAKRRNTLEAELGPLSEKLGQINQVKKQVDKALALLNKQETDLIESFKAEGGELTRKIVALKANREKAASSLNSALLALYEKKLQRGGGIAVAQLSEGVCSVCRNQFDEGKLLQIKTEAPLSTCPSCKRMLVIIDV